MRRMWLGTTALLVAEAALASGALAQDASETIIVTATRRDESVLSVPSNITAVTGAQLERSGVTDISGLVRLAPGLGLFDEGPRTSGNNNTFNLRGLNANTANNNDDNPSLVQPSVSVYLGETPIFFPLKLVDLERVEVLRGPQGTLYGAGSVGGTVRFVPKAPDPSGFTADLTVETSVTESASDPSYDAYATVNLPVTDRFALRFSAGQEHLSGFIDAVGLIEQTGTPRVPGGPALADPSDPLFSPAALAAPVEDHNDADVAFFRGSALFTPSDAVEIQVNYAHQEVEADGRYEDNPEFGTGEDYVSYRAYMEPQDSELDLVNGDVHFDLGFARLTSASSYSEVDTRSISDSSGFLRTNLAYYYFGFPRLFSPLTRTQDVATFSQELRLVSQGGGRFDWLVGAFYLKRDSDFTILQVMPGINDYTNAVLGVSPPADFGDVLVDGGTDQTFEDLAAFGEVTYHLTDRLSVTGGARAFRTKTEGVGGVPLPFASRTTSFFYYIDPLDSFLLGGFEQIDAEFTDQIFKANIAYDVSDDMLVYATWAQGFRPGGANALPAVDPFGNDNSAILTYEPDTANNYEAGVKGSAGGMSYTATAFYVDWEDFQTVLYSPFGQNFVDNVPSARSVGFEGEVSGSITDSLRAALGYTYVDAETTSTFELRSGDPSTTIESGTTLPGSAKHALSGALDYTWMLPGGSELTAHGDASYRGESATGFRDIPGFASEGYVELDAFTVLNAAMTWRRDQVAVTLFGENLSNERGTTHAIAPDLLGDSDQSRSVIRPRSFGLRLNLSL